MTVGLPPFQVFLDDHREEVYRFLAGTVAPRDVDDCFQETFLSALRAYPKLRARSNLRSWIMTIAYRKAMDSFRARRTERQRRVEHAPDVATFERDHSVWHVVRALPPKQRAAVVQRYANGLPYREIAAITETSEDAARQNVREGLKKLKEWLA